MTVPRTFLSLIGALMLPLVNIAAAAEAKPAPSRQAAMESTAQKQREATLAAMQASIDKQRASIAIGKNATKATPATSFFQLPPPAPLAGGASVSPPAQEPVMPDINCEPLPVANVTPVLEQAARREGLDPRLLTAVIQQESGFRPCVISRKGAQGLMQLMPATIEQFGVTDPFEVKQNIDAGAKFLKELIGRYSGNLALALGAYNAGPGSVDAADGVPQNAETMAYVSEILGKLGIQPAPPNNQKP
jgi:soluble lytic murein transglycosylase-like protein